ncbi:unnamed protein product, partial [Adineta steineri]
EILNKMGDLGSRI